MELLEDIMGSSDGENTPPVWAKHTTAKSTRYGNASQPQASNLEFLRDKDNSDYAVTEQKAWADSTLVECEEACAEAVTPGEADNLFHESDAGSQSSNVELECFSVVEDKFSFNDFGYNVDNAPIKSSGRYNFDDIPTTAETSNAKSNDAYRMPEKMCEADKVSVESDNFSDVPDNIDDFQDMENLCTENVSVDDSDIGEDLVLTSRGQELLETYQFAHSHPERGAEPAEPGTAKSLSTVSRNSVKSETHAISTTVGDADTTASPATASTITVSTTSNGRDIVKKPFLRKGARLQSSLRLKGSSAPVRAASKTLNLMKGVQDAATPSAPSSRPSTPPAQPSVAAMGRSAPMPRRTKTMYTGPASAGKHRPQIATKSPRDLMWDEDSEDEIVRDTEDKLSFMDFMRDKGLSQAEFQRMEARTQHLPVSKTPDFGIDPLVVASSGKAGKDTSQAGKVVPTGRDLFDEDAHARTAPIPTKKGFREYYREKFGGDEDSREAAFPGLCAAVGNNEHTEKRAFRSLYHNGVGTSQPSREARKENTPQEMSYAALWQEEVAKKTERRWDETEPSEIFDKDTAPVSNLVRKHFYKEQPKAKAAPKPLPEPKEDEEMGMLLQQKLTLLDAQIARFKKENEQCKKLRIEREQALRDAEREREKMQAEFDNERERMRAALEEEHEKVRKERKRIEQDRERHRQQLTQSRADQDEAIVLKQQAIEMKEDFVQKEQRWRRTVERLQKQNDDLKKKYQEANDEIAWAQKGAANAGGRRTPTASSSATPATCEKAKLRTPSTSARTAPACGSTAVKPALAKAQDSRVERVHADGSREIEFPNGLKKILHPDGSCLVQFANGDTKESRKDGHVIYRYHGTQATQTTLPDKTEIYEFASGQIETHFANGSKEITFPNGTIKHIAADGMENISFSQTPKPSLNA